jgi:hypothetical protein
MSDSPAPLADPHLVHDPVAGDGPKDVVILGSTGSIGTQAIDLVLRNPDRFRVTGLSANGGRVALLAEQAYRLRPCARRSPRSTARASRSPSSSPARTRPPGWRHPTVTPS